MPKAKTPKVQPPHHDRVLIIVEETVQRAYLMLPDDIITGRVAQAAKHHVLQEPTAPVPPLIGKRIKKGADPIPEEWLPRVEAETRRVTCVTVVYPDEVGNPALEVKVTPTTATQRPVSE